MVWEGLSRKADPYPDPWLCTFSAKLLNVKYLKTKAIPALVAVCILRIFFVNSHGPNN